MPSIKCTACGLVNFSTASNCKRCQRPLNESALTARQRSYQPAGPDYNAPPPPPMPGDNCVKCGAVGNISIQEFKKTYLPPAIYGAAIAPLLLLILIGIFKVTHKVRAPFCRPCWQRFKSSRIVLWITAALSIFLAGGSIFAFTIFDSILGFMAVFIIAIASYLIGYIYHETSNPKFKKVDKKVVVIETPNMGEVNYAAQ